ncbi:conserved hypothetical protein [Gammaproteobacteria bacterium]
MSKLTTTDHDRDSAGLTYVYPVISRRSGGLSIGINLNPNQACNWQCVYCQVPNLIRGAAPKIDLLRLTNELSELLESIEHGNFYERYLLPKEQRKICDIAISGNGEPTSCREFDTVVEIIGQIYRKFELFESANLILITNGSLILRPEVQRGLSIWAKLGGRVWFKLDSATEEGRHRINNFRFSQQNMLRYLKMCARLCPTWIQTCLFAFDGQPPTEAEQQAYLYLLAEVQHWENPVKGVLLYGLARPSRQPEAPRLSRLSSSWLEIMGRKVNQIGLSVSISD